MTPGSPARAAAASASSRPNRLVFRPLEPRRQNDNTPTTAAASAAPSHAPATENSSESPSQKSNRGDEYDIDFELDDDDAEAIEQVFADYTKKLNDHERKEKLLAPPTSSARERVAPPSKLSAHVEIEEEQAEQEDYHDSLALDSLLDLEYDDAELLAALVVQELPSSQNAKDEKPPRSSDTYWTSSQEDIDGQEIDRQVLWEHEQWLKRTKVEESALQVEDIVDNTPETIEARTEEEQKQEAYEAAQEAGEPLPIEDSVEDTRSPLDRWRSKAGLSKLSVSDLLSNMWCEQQHHYTLLRGFKRRTAEMQAGTKIHREIEEEIHTVVPVTVKSRHDKWGLRVWNMIQGMESLRTVGLTRELEVWGWIDGVFINGVIDEVNFTKFRNEARDEKENQKVEDIDDKAEELEVPSAKNDPDANITAAGESSKEIPETPKKKRGRPKKNPDPVSPEPATPKQQSSILDFITPSPKKTRSKGKPAYVLDLKTRFSSRIPEPGSSQSKSVHIQLMLYRQLLNDMIKATPKSMVKRLCRQQDIPADEPFSDDMIAELAGLDNGTEPGSDDLTVLLENNSIEKLYTLYHRRLKQTISMIAPELTVVYRWQQNGEFLDSADYMADDAYLKEHVDNVIAWWKGERATVGVEINEAWKCNKCEFMEDCTWRLNKAEEAMQRARSRRANMV